MFKPIQSYLRLLGAQRPELHRRRPMTSARAQKRRSPVGIRLETLSRRASPMSGLPLSFHR